MQTPSANDLVVDPAVEEASPAAPALPATMPAAVARRYGTAEVVEMDEVPVPVPGADEILVRVAASSLNALDWHMLTGTPYLLRPSAGLRRPKQPIRGADVAGTVVALGDGDHPFEVGDAVFGECGGGGCAPYLAVKADNVVAKPADVSFEAAGAAPVAGLTALQGLRTHADVQPGDRVLINGAAGGVGTFAVQIARALGAEVTAVCSTGNVDMVAELGANEVIDYTKDDFATGGPRFDVMLDNVGNRTPAECLGVLRPDARYVVTSGPKKNRWLGPVPHIARTALAFWRADPSFHQFVASPDRDDLTFLGELMATGQLTPRIQRVIGLDGVAEGLAEIGTGPTKAKIVVVPA
ncbi:MAG: NAD(P)-dependent alcohol dehydrogenase [Acidimicrobiales bacterium]